ncbi:acyl-CoA dehydrogenase [Egicoccus halophilus]|uniref:Acyl-CoA dehydrogenase n=1 Tax=Egicoccus halophilus TaxID=1670830 RepID=A0A8J3EYP7_9ACTN|nr:acyl-CoA dehydrogenase [Egicoccus halophilus]GGI08324.1 acyl-CoA dehydrogenase [Egicoccus halophilus]
MSHYKSNLRDIEFNLYEVFGAEDYFGTGPFAAVDADQARMLLGELDRFTRNSIWAESFVPADRTPLELSPEGDITIPEELDQALRAFYEAGWHLLPLPTHLGGFGAPPSIRWAASELLSGGHATAMLWPIGALMGAIIDQVGTEGQKARFGRPMIERCWGGTMVLTEPDAGSDVGAGVTRAVRVEDNGDDDLGAVYHLEGIKRFITSADAQTHENTVHLVLARPEHAGPGTKGLSLFIVPKLHVDAEGDLGERNGVRVSNLEKKMGIKGSATCELSLGQDGTPCVGYLVGDVHDGIRQMFLVIEYARMMVGTKAMATLSTGYLNALDYAKVRVQGADLTRSTDKRAPKVEIIQHPDVRRLLIEQKAHAEGMRALVMYTGWVQDQAQLHGEDAEEHARWIAREDLLLPLVKGYCSEKAYELLALSLQTFGGSGFTQDYPVEQYLRDAKIDTLYEGTTAIQALDLLFRKIVRDQGATLTWLADQVRELVKAGRDDDPFARERQALGQALEDVSQHLGILVGHAMASMDETKRAEIYKAGLNSTEFLYSLAEVVIGWLLLRQAEIAQDQLDAAVTNGDGDFYTGKVASARWFLRTVPPKVALRRQKAQVEDGWLMEVPESAF